MTLSDLLRRATLPALAGTVAAGLLAASALAPAAHASAASGVAHRDSTSPSYLIATDPMPVLAANPTNPLAGARWGTYGGLAEPSWLPYLGSIGAQHTAIGKIALAPKSKWFGSWIPDDVIGKKVDEYLDATTHGDPTVLAQMTLARVQPWETDVCHRLPTAAEKTSYARWIDSFVAAIGDARTAIVVEPDGPFARCAPHHSKIPSHLIRDTVRKLATLPNTSVYIEMGSDDWFHGHTEDPIRLLLDAGVKSARGFALDTTHYDSTASEIAFGTKLVGLLAKKGVPDRHFVIDTGDNGKPFTGAWFHQHYGHGSLMARAPVCTSTSQSHCITAGIPPTTDVANPAWHLTSKQRAQAAAHVDGYLWVSRPWLGRPSQLWDLRRALDVVKTAPFL